MQNRHGRRDIPAAYASCERAVAICCHTRAMVQSWIGYQSPTRRRPLLAADNGPEFVAHAVSNWCRFNQRVLARGVQAQRPVGLDHAVMVRAL